MKPFLGRFDLSESFKPMAKFEDVMKSMRNIPQIYWALPYLLSPLPAMAEDIRAPPGFESLPNVYGTGFPQNFIEVNK